jgi:hypothetical protein
MNIDQDVSHHKDTNWVAEKDSVKFGKILGSKLTTWQTLVTSNDLEGLYRSNIRLAYAHNIGLSVDGDGANQALVTRAGEQNTLARIRVPAAQSILNKLHGIVCGPELSISCHATNTDYASIAKSLTAKQAIQYYFESEGVSALGKQVALGGLRFGEAALHCPWNPNKGPLVSFEPVVDEAGQPVLDDDGRAVERPVYAGDIEFSLVQSWNIIRDPSLKSFEQAQFIMIREWKNRWDMAAACKNPEAREACIRASSVVVDHWSPVTRVIDANSDLIPVYFFYHKMSPSVVHGRQTVLLETGEVISDGPLSKAYHNQLPVVRFNSDEIPSTPWPTCRFFTILGTAQSCDALLSDILTNVNQTSQGLVSAEREDDISPIQLSAGAKIIYREKGSSPPTPIILQQPQTEAFNLIHTLRSEMNQLMGLDAIASGQITGEGMSGYALALLASSSVQNASQLQFKYSKFLEAVGTVILGHIQYSMKGSRRIALAGKNRSSLVTTTEYSGAAVQGIDRVQIEIQSAASQTAAGRMTMAQEMAKNGWIESPQQLQEVADSGNIDSLNQGVTAAALLIDEENEELGEGNTVPVMVTDDHVAHIKGHRVVMSALATRMNPKAQIAFSDHELRHITMLKDPGNADLFTLLGYPVLQPQPGNMPQVLSGGEAVIPLPSAGPTMSPSSQSPEELQQTHRPEIPASEAPNGTIPPKLAIGIKEG